MPRTSVLQFSLAAALLAGCGDDGPGSGADPVDYPECLTPGQFVLEGELDGRTIAVTHEYTGFLFANALSGESGILEVTFDPTRAQRIEINFSTLIARGDETDARGIVDLTDDDVVAGNCEADGLSGRLAQTDDGEVYMFVLRDLKASPFCGGAALAGELRGCVRSEQ